MTLSPSLICQEGLEEAIEYCELDSEVKKRIAEDFKTVGLTMRKGYIAKDVTALLIDHIQDIIRRKKKAFCDDSKQNSDDYGYTSYDDLWSLMKERGMTKKELISKSDISSEEFDAMKNNKDVKLAALRGVSKLLNKNLSEIIDFIF